MPRLAIIYQCIINAQSLAFNLFDTHLYKKLIKILQGDNMSRNVTNSIFNYKKITTSIAFITAAMSANIQAQEVEEIRVTGSFIARPADRPQSITVLNNEELKSQSRTSMGEIIRDLPQVTAVNWSANFLNPTNNINLRGLGSRATLVLMNGKRMTIDANNAAAVDVNNLAPAIMIERVEILTDGASALYGSDAVAGVANFITRNDFEGFDLTTSMQYADAESTPEWNVGAIFGSQSDRTSVVAGFEFVRRSNSMNSEDRYSEERLQKYALQSSFGNPGSFQPAGGAPIADPLCGSEELGGGLSAGYLNGTSPQCQLNLGLGRSFIPESERLNGLAVMTHNFDANFVEYLQVEVGFARTRYSSDYGFGVPILFPLPIVPARNPGVVEANRSDPSFLAQDYGVWSRAASPLESAIPSHTEQDTVRIAAELHGNFGSGNSWDWMVSGTMSQNNTLSISSDAIKSRYQLALQGYGGGNCAFNPDNDPSAVQAGVGDCAYWNPFANRLLANESDAFHNDEATRSWFAAGPQIDGSSRLMTLNGLVTGELWEMAGGTTGLAVGAQFRTQDYTIDYDDISNDGGFSFVQEVFNDFDGTRDTSAIFAELVLYPTDTIELQLAARYEDYDGVSSTEPKVGVLWTPTDNLFVRATAGTSFRQPGEGQSFGASTGSVSRIVVGGEIPQAGGIVYGDPSLEPETSDNWTIGFTWDVSDSLTVDLTYWSVEFENLIVGEDANVILTQDMSDGYLNDPRIVLYDGAPSEVCEVTGRWDGSSSTPLPTGCVTGFDIEQFKTNYINQDYQKTAGWDYTMNYSFEFGGSDMMLSLAGTYTPTYELTSEDIIIDGAGSYNSSNFGSENAEHRTNLSLDWRKGDHYARATYRYLSKLTNDDPGTQPDTEEKSFSMLDLVYSYSMPWFETTQGTLNLSVVNALDEEDPARDSSLTTNTSLVYDPRGRMYRMGVDFSF